MGNKIRLYSNVTKVKHEKSHDVYAGVDRADNLYLERSKHQEKREECCDDQKIEDVQRQAEINKDENKRIE